MAPGLERRLGLAPGSIDPAGPFDPAADPLRRRFRAGEFAGLGYWQRQAARHAGMINAGEDHLRSLMDALFEAPRDEVLRPDTWQLRQTLIDRGLRVAALTNDLSRFHGPVMDERMDMLDRFDPFVDLSNTGILQPDLRGYKRGLDGLGLEADQTLFVDDQPINIAGAEAVSMEAVHFDVLDRPASIARVLAVL